VEIIIVVVGIAALAFLVWLNEHKGDDSGNEET